MCTSAEPVCWDQTTKEVINPPPDQCLSVIEDYCCDDRYKSDCKIFDPNPANSCEKEEKPKLEYARFMRWAWKLEMKFTRPI
jgi:hypothetical protein